MDRSRRHDDDVDMVKVKCLQTNWAVLHAVLDSDYIHYYCEREDKKYAYLKVPRFTLSVAAYMNYMIQ